MLSRIQSYYLPNMLLSNFRGDDPACFKVWDKNMYVQPWTTTTTPTTSTTTADASDADGADGETEETELMSVEREEYERSAFDVYGSGKFVGKDEEMSRVIEELSDKNNVLEHFWD